MFLLMLLLIAYPVGPLRRLSGQPLQEAEHYEAIMAHVGLQPEAFDR